MTLPLFGVAKNCKGFPEDSARIVVRLTSPEVAEPLGDCDFSLIKSIADVSRAVDEKHRSIFVINEAIDISASIANRFDRIICLPARFDYLAAGDVLGIHIPTKQFRTLFRSNSRHNSFLVTERCNNYCLMCSQPPKDIDDRWILDEIKRSLPLIPKSTRTLTFTGGEPLSDWIDFVEILADCRDLLPNTAIQVLTNGRAFASSEIVDAWKSVSHPSLIAAIPVYASVDHLHDYVVQAKGAFDETILGILKLKDRGQRVEVRVVLHSYTAPTIAETSRWIARNLPFVDHVALMGMENTGFALANEKSLWIDPMDYRESLAEGVQTLSATGMNVSIYNLPLCVIEPSIWPHAVQSISDWKNGYVEECEKCAQKSNCSGLFTSGRPRQSRGISAILNQQPAA
jgi:His-Xaa-Ser system radical SAM maturase HxsC